jgi:hypothetical protein
MPTICTACKTSYPCACDKASVSIVQPPCTPKQKAALWVVVRDDTGKGVKDVTIALTTTAATNLGAMVSTTESETDSDGLFKCDFEESGSVQVDLVKLPDAICLTHVKPKVSKKIVSVTLGSVSHVFFDLIRSGTLLVKLVRCNKANDIPAISQGATVFVDHVTNVLYVNGRKELITENAKSAPPKDGVARFLGLPKGKYRVRVEFAKDKRDTYGANEVVFELEAEENKTVNVPVEEFFKKVQFIGLCVAAIARQIWQGANDLVIEHELIKAETPWAVPDPEQRYASYLVDVKNYWGAADQKNERFSAQDVGWKARYNGRPGDKDDITARVTFLGNAMQKAKDQLNADSDTTLKVFLVPECFFLGRYGAFPQETFGEAIHQLQQLVKDPKWKSWIFGFGTINGFYELGGRMEMFNIAPVIRGGWGCFGDNPSRFTKLQLKSAFSAELPAEDDLLDDKDAQRDPLYEEMLSAGFQATQNEEIIGQRLEKILEDLEDGNLVDTANRLGWPAPRCEAIRDNTKQMISNDGLYYTVRLIRGGPDGPRSKKLKKLEEAQNIPNPGWKDWMTDLKSMLDKYMEDHPEINLTFEDTSRQMNFRDYCLSGMRMAGPWLDNVVDPDEGDLHHKLTFVVETCADHLISVFAEKAAPNAVPKVDIHLVPSAGANLKDGSLTYLRSGGYAFNCDGWNCANSGPFLRNAKVIIVEDELAPRRLGNNPLLPHTELWRAKSDQTKQADDREFKEKLKSWNKTKDQMDKQYKEDTDQYVILTETWKQEYEQWQVNKTGPPPEPPSAPVAPPKELASPINFTAIAADVTILPLDDKIDDLLPYDVTDQSAKWTEVERKVNERVAEREKQKREQEEGKDAEQVAKLKELVRKEDLMLNKNINGVPSGTLKMSSLDELKAALSTAQQSGNAMGIKNHGTNVTKRETLIQQNRDKINAWNQEIAALELKIQSAKPGNTGVAASTNTIKLRPMNKKAVPELHIYPSQDLPVAD